MAKAKTRKKDVPNWSDTLRNDVRNLIDSMTIAKTESEMEGCEVACNILSDLLTGYDMRLKELQEENE